MRKIVSSLLDKLGIYRNKYQNRLIKEAKKDLFSLHNLPNLDVSYVPWTDVSLRPAGVCALLNEISIHDRKNILEFGSGISTIFFANHLEDLSSSGCIVSIENDKGWAKVVEKYIKEIGVSRNRYKIIHSSLKSYEKNEDEKKIWYDIKDIEQKVLNRKYDLIFVDGPTVWKNNMETVRQPALPFVYDYTCRDFAIFLDDIDRSGEKFISKKWKINYDLRMKKVAGMGCFRPKNSGSNYEIL
jgi:predicted O-methyltransferase YrrM